MWREGGYRRQGGRREGEEEEVVLREQRRSEPVRRSLLQRRHDDDALEPSVLAHVLGRRPRLGIRIEHPLDDVPALARNEVRERWRRGGGRVHLEVRAEGGVGRLGDAPGEFLKVHAVEDDGAGPDVDEAGIVLCARAGVSVSAATETTRNAPF